MSDKKFLEIKSKEKFYLNDKRFYVFYKERGDSEPILLKTNYFDIEETDVGYEIVVKKVGGYVGLNVPVFSKLIVGDQFFSVDDFDGQKFCYNKTRFANSCKFSEDEYTNTYYPIIHNVINESKALSVSPSSEEEVIITPYRDYFDDYVRIQTYSHYQNEYIRFFLDISANYHLNLRRVSDSLSRKTVNLDSQSSVIEFQDVLYNNIQITKSSDDNSKFKKFLRVFIPFVENVTNRKLVFQGDFSLWLNDYIEDPPEEITGIVGVKKEVDFHEVRVRLLNEIRKKSWIDMEDVDKISKEDSLIKFDFGSKVVNVLFSSGGWNNYKDRVIKENKLVYLNPESELKRRILEYQSISSGVISKKRNKELRQKIEKLAWRVKVKDGFSNKSLLDLITGISSENFRHYFKDYFSEFDFNTFRKIKNMVLGDVERGFLDVRVSEPFFVSVFEDVYSYYFVVVNPNCFSEKFRMVVGGDFDNSKWIGLKKEESSKLHVENFMEHKEIYVNSVKFGGVLITSKK